MKYAIPMIVLFVLGSASSVQAGERRFNDGNRGIDGPSRGRNPLCAGPTLTARDPVAARGSTPGPTAGLR